MESLLIFTLLYLGPPLVIVGGIAFFLSWLRMRGLRTRSVVQTLATIVGRNIPLVDGVRAASDQESPAMRAIFVGIADRLALGDPLSAALRAAFPACPGSVTGAIQAGEQSGTLPSVLHTQAADLSRERHALKAVTAFAPYLFVLMGATVALLGLTAVSVLPKLRYILADFGFPTPPVMQQVFNVLDLLSDNSMLAWTITAGLLVAVAQLTFVPHFVRRLPDRFQPLFAAWDALIWHMPGLRRVSETRALARQLPILQAGIRAGYDVAPAARHAYCADANYFARKRLLRWAERIERGGQPGVEARRLGFPTPLVSAFTQPGPTERLSRSLEYLAFYYSSLLIHWEQILVSALLPCIVVFWAGIVAAIAVGFFQSIMYIVDSLIGEIY